LAHRLTDRPTHDLDFFTAPERGDVPHAWDEFERAVRERGWHVERIQDTVSFCRLIIRGGAEELLVDLAVDSPPGHPGAVTIAGPAFEAEELAGRKVLALFDRAEARDFVDVYLLAKHFSKEVLVARAAEIDPGFNLDIFLDMLGTLGRFSDPEIPIPDKQVDAVRAFFTGWRAELSA
jgi:nucleotidyltransferase AbiEii toxin of type IV toxin-antitoxin system